MEFFIILLLLFLNGIFAMYELALVSSSKARLETMVSKGNKRAKSVLKQLEEPEKFLSTIQIGITLIGIVSGAYGGATLADEIEPLFLLIPGLAPYANTLAVATIVVIITYLSLIVGELVPKSIALSDPEKWATRLSALMVAVKNISYPFVLLLSASNQAGQQADWPGRRLGTPNDAGRTEDDPAPEFGTRCHRQGRDGDAARRVPLLGQARQ